MRFAFTVVILIVFSCNQERTPADPFSFSKNPAVITLEGRVPLGNDNYLYHEISFLEGQQTGEGKYLLREILETSEGSKELAFFEGQYSSVFGVGENQQDVLITLESSGLEPGVTRVYKADPTKRIITEEVFRKKNLRLIRENDYRYLVLDNYGHAIANDPEYNLYRRSSRIFTVEGYFTHVGSQGLFTEMNTGDEWLLGKMGDYGTVLKQYYQLRNEKSERLYVKAIGFTTNATDSQGKTQEILVIKKIIEMQSSAIPDGQ